MSKRITALAALVIGILFTGRALACDSAMGSIAKIEAAKNTLIVDGAGCCDHKQMTFVLKKETKVLVNGKAATLADLRSGR